MPSWSFREGPLSAVPSSYEGVILYPLTTYPELCVAHVKYIILCDST